MEKRARDALKAACDEARYVEVEHSDGAMWNRTGELRSLWTIAATAATVYRIYSDGSRKAIEPVRRALIGLVVSDRASSLNVFYFTRAGPCAFAPPGRSLLNAT